MPEHHNSNRVSPESRGLESGPHKGHPNRVVLSIPGSYGLNRPICGGQNRFFHLIQGQASRGDEIVVLESIQDLDPADSSLASIETFRDTCFLGRRLSILRDLNFDFATQLAG